jgi:[acyl-carrier-protein] S-malonyltransferase
MAAIIGMDAETVDLVCQEATAQATAKVTRGEAGASHPGEGKVIVANFNAPGQIVISGEQKALAFAMELAKERGAKRVIPLPVSGAFHSPVMQPAAVGLAQAISTTLVRNAIIPIISNINAAPLTEACTIREELAQQIAASVQWTHTIEYLTHVGVTVFIEIGPGQALTGMVKRIAKGATTITVSSAADIEKSAILVHEMGLCHEV